MTALKVLKFAKAGIAQEIQDRQKVILAQERFGSNAVIDIFHFNPLKEEKPTRFDDLIELAKQIQTAINQLEEGVATDAAYTFLNSL